MAERDWYAWHAPYDDPDSGLSRRLAWVQDRVRAALDSAPPGPLRAISLCAGQGADLIVPLASHPRRDDVTARLVELDPRNAGVARRLAAEAGLARLEVVLGDAALTSQYADMVPADLVLVCGVFGNMTDAGVARVIGYCTQLCAAGGTVIWTRGRWEPDLVPQVCAWFEERGFDRLWLSGAEHGQCVGAHRFTGSPGPLERDAVMFRFNDHDVRHGPDRVLPATVLTPPRQGPGCGGLSSRRPRSPGPSTVLVARPQRLRCGSHLVPAPGVRGPVRCDVAAPHCLPVPH